ncbi:MAG: hypothetical protein RML40_08775 [Bacteroidota bacterium]|nr:hypothetical protein [Candidatus Kapabacteria bacterium]MDW8220610.1 hypothetical protein [Bacteroidota bacterium]
MNAIESIEYTTYNPHSGELSFPLRMDFYWQAIAVYAIALLCYILIRGTFWDGSIDVILHDPIVLVLGFLVALSCAWLLGNWFMQRSLVLGSSYICLRNRFRTRIIDFCEIEAISIGKQKILRVRGMYKVIKIRLRSRRRLLRIRPSLYEREQELVQALSTLKRRIANKP